MAILINSAGTQVYILAIELSQPNIYPIYNLQKYMKGLILYSHDHMVYTLGATAGYLGSFHVGPVLMMYQRSEALNLTNSTLHNEHLQGKAVWTKEYPAWHTAAPNVTKTNEEMMVIQRGTSKDWFCLLICFFSFVSLVFLFVFLLAGFYIEINIHICTLIFQFITIFLIFLIVFIFLLIFLWVIHHKGE